MPVPTAWMPPRLAGSTLVRKRVVLVRDDPAAALLAQPDGQPKAVAWVLLELVVRPTAEQRVREGDVDTGSDLERDDLEGGALPLPFEEGWPRRVVSLDAADPSGGGTSNITISSACPARTPPMSPACTAFAQRSINARISDSSDIGMPLPRSVEL